MVSSHLMLLPLISSLFFSFHSTPLLSFPFYCLLPRLGKSTSPSTLISYIILSFCIIFFSSLPQAAFLSYFFIIHHCTTLSLLFFCSLGHSISLSLFISRSLTNIPSGIYSYLWHIFLLLEYILTSRIHSFFWNLFFLLEYILSPLQRSVIESSHAKLGRNAVPSSMAQYAFIEDLYSSR